MTNLRRFAVMVAVAMCVPIVPFVLIGELPGADWLAATGTDTRLFTALAAGLLIADVLLPVPSSIVLGVLGAHLALPQSWLLGWLALTCGHFIGYLLGRLWPQRFAPRVDASPVVFALVVSRAVPVFAEAMTFAAGAARIPVPQFVFACLAGNCVYSLALTLAGAALISGDHIFVSTVLVLLVVATVVWWLARRRAD